MIIKPAVFESYLLVYAQLSIFFRLLSLLAQCLGHPREESRSKVQGPLILPTQEPSQGAESSESAGVFPGCIRLPSFYGVCLQKPSLAPL